LSPSSVVILPNVRSVVHPHRALLRLSGGTARV
jgi:hypothetical protein